MNVLIVRVGAMGDVLHALPAVTALHRARPDAHIDWAIEDRWQPLLSGDAVHPALHRAVPVAIRQWKRRPLSVATLRSLRELRRLRGHYDLVVDLQGTMRSAAIGWLAGGRARLAGYADPREAPAARLYGRRLDRRGAHVVEQTAALLAQATGTALDVGSIATPASSLPIELPFRQADELWADRDAVLARPSAVLAPSAGWPAKQWPTQRFGELAQALHDRGFTVLVNAASSADPQARAVVDASRGAARLIACDVSRLIALLRRTDLLVGGDSGPMHLAAALAVPLVALFGPTDPQRNGPWGPGRSRVLRHASSITSYSHASTADAGLAQIGVDEVLAAALDVNPAAFARR